MKKVILKRIKLDDAPVGAPKVLDYQETILGLITTPKNPQAGASFEEMVEAIPLHAKVKAYKMPEIGDGEILLEDADHKAIVDRLKGGKFMANSVEIYEMIQSVIDAETVEIEHQEAG
jgi:hypothetical protein